MFSTPGEDLWDMSCLWCGGSICVCLYSSADPWWAFLCFRRGILSSHVNASTGKTACVAYRCAPPCVLTVNALYTGLSGLESFLGCRVQCPCPSCLCGNLFRVVPLHQQGVPWCMALALHVCRVRANHTSHGEWDISRHFCLQGPNSLTDVSNNTGGCHEEEASLGV